jgi:hypothetical protein
VESGSSYVAIALLEDGILTGKNFPGLKQTGRTFAATAR